MALLFMDGFEAQDQGIKWTSAVGSSSATTRFGSGKSILLTQASLRKNLYGTAQMFAGAALNTPGFSYNGVGFTMYGGYGTHGHLSVVIFANVINLNLYNASNNSWSTVATAPGTYYTNTWYYLEMMATFAAAGVCQVRLNGTTVINYSGNTLCNTTEATVDCFELNSVSAGGGQCLFDDVYVCDATGTRNNTFLGDVRVQTIFPTGAGSSTQLTPTGSANNYANVNDVPDSTTTYNSSTTVGSRDTYVMGQLLANTGTIYGMQESIHAFKTDAGTANMKAALKSGSSIYYDPTQSLGASVAWSAAVHETDPATSAPWTVTGLDSIEFGAEVA